MKKEEIQDLLDTEDATLGEILDVLPVSDFRLLLAEVLSGMKDADALNKVCRVFYKDTQGHIRVGCQANTRFDANFPKACEYLKGRIKTFEQMKAEHKGGPRKSKPKFN